MSILDNVIDEHVRRTCHCQEAADSTRDVIAKEIAGIRREAAVKALREAADDMDARANGSELIRKAERWKGYYLGVLSSILYEEAAIRHRADRLEAGE